MNVAGLNACWLQKDLTHEETQKFTINVLNHMRERLSDYQEKYGDLYNLEATPAESTSYRFAKHDKEKFPDIITANENGTPYYTNSSHLPVGYTEDVFKALDIQDELQTLYTSGTVFHVFLGEKLPSWQSAATLVKKIAENYALPYYTLSPTYSICKEHGYLAGEQTKCPICGEPAEIYSRITGYYRPVKNWNDGKSQEFKDRVTYTIASGFEKECKKDQKKESKKAQKANTKAMLFVTKTCPNCQLAKRALDEAKISYDVIEAEENPELVKELEITQAPTLITKEGEKIPNASNITKYAEESKVAI